MYKKIALVCENPNEWEMFHKSAQIIAQSGDMKISITPNPPIDKNSYDTVIFVFEREPHNHCQTLNNWVGHQHIVCVKGADTNERFNDFARVFRHVCGIPAPLEIERKFLIKYPPIRELDVLNNCCAVDISQVYLDIPNANIRVRKRTVDGVCTCIRTEKSKITEMTRLETETIISQIEYDELIKYKYTDTETIEKIRYCLMHNGQYFEIDIFPFWNDKAYLEAELISEDDTIELPPYIEVIKEVTADKRYTNKSLAGLLKKNMVNTL